MMQLNYLIRGLKHIRLQGMRQSRSLSLAYITSSLVLGYLKCWISYCKHYVLIKTAFPIDVLIKFVYMNQKYS